MVKKMLLLLFLFLVLSLAAVATHLTSSSAASPISSNVNSDGRMYIATAENGGLIQIEAAGTPALPHINLIDPAGKDAGRLYVTGDSLYIERGPATQSMAENNQRTATQPGYTGRIRFHDKGYVTIENPMGSIALSPDGLVGIGNARTAASPDAKLSIFGGPPWTKVNWHKAISLGNADAIQFTGKTSFGLGASSSGDSLYFFTATDEGTTSPPAYRMVIESDGKIGVGKINPRSMLDVANDIRAQKLFIGNNTLASYPMQGFSKDLKDITPFLAVFGKNEKEGGISTPNLNVYQKAKFGEICMKGECRDSWDFEGTSCKVNTARYNEDFNKKCEEGYTLQFSWCDGDCNADDGKASVCCPNMEKQQLGCLAIPREDFVSIGTCPKEYPAVLTDFCTGDCGGRDARIRICCKVPVGYCLQQKSKCEKPGYTFISYQEATGDANVNICCPATTMLNLGLMG